MQSIAVVVDYKNYLLKVKKGEYKHYILLKAPKEYVKRIYFIANGHIEGYSDIESNEISDFSVIENTDDKNLKDYIGSKYFNLCGKNDIHIFSLRRFVPIIPKQYNGTFVNFKKVKDDEMIERGDFYE